MINNVLPATMPYVRKQTKIFGAHAVEKIPTKVAIVPVIVVTREE